MRDVVLVHGLWVPAIVMTPLAARLRIQGYRCHLFDYPGHARPVEAHAERLARLARAIGRAHFIGHSLGGLVVLEALERHRDVAVGHTVLLGTPAKGNFSGRRLSRHAFGRWMLGATEPLWREGHSARWTRPEPLGVIAGTMPVGLGRLFGALPGANDGVVRVAETEVEGMRDHVALNVGHSAMLLSARAAAQVKAFLERARFDHPR